jgi:hypothetical protein
MVLVRATRAALEISSVWESGSQFPQATRQSRRERTDGYLAWYLAGRRAVLGARIAVRSLSRVGTDATEPRGVYEARSRMWFLRGDMDRT